MNLCVKYSSLFCTQRVIQFCIFLNLLEMQICSTFFFMLSIHRKLMRLNMYAYLSLYKIYANDHWLFRLEYRPKVCWNWSLRFVGFFFEQYNQDPLPLIASRVPWTYVHWLDSCRKFGYLNCIKRIGGTF